MEREGKKMAVTGLLKEAKLSFQRKIKTLQAKHLVPEDLILNSDQTHCPMSVPLVILSMKRGQKVCHL